MVGRKKHPKCIKCGKTTEVIGNYPDGRKLFGCKTPEVCGWKEYEFKA